MAEENPNTKPEDFSCEISMEVDQLISLSELVGGMSNSCDVRDKFFYGLGIMISGSAERIGSMLDPTYKIIYQGGRSLALDQVREKAEGKIFLQLRERWINEMKASWKKRMDQLIKIKDQKEINPQEIAGVIKSIEDFVLNLWFVLEKQAAFTIDDLIPGDDPADCEAA